MQNIILIIATLKTFGEMSFQILVYLVEGLWGLGWNLCHQKVFLNIICNNDFGETASHKDVSLCPVKSLSSLSRFPSLWGYDGHSSGCCKCLCLLVFICHSSLVSQKHEQILGTLCLQQTHIPRGKPTEVLLICPSIFLLWRHEEQTQIIGIHTYLTTPQRMSMALTSLTHRCIYMSSFHGCTAT